MTQKSVYRLTESAVLLAIASVLSIIKLVDMPYGGSVTLMSMLPLIVIAYRYGTRFGLVAATAYSLIQLLLGLDNLSYATSFGAAVAIIVFDYLVAFLVLGLGGIFRKAVPHQGLALSLGAVVTGVLRYLCHVISGCTVWYGLSVPTAESLWYSLGYNLYMLPEIVILVAGSLYLSRILNFGGQNITRAPATETLSVGSAVLSGLGATAAVVAAIWDVILITPYLQTPDAAVFLQGLRNVPWTQVAIITAAGLGLCVIFTLLAKRKK